MKRKWGKYGEVSTTWGADWYYMRIPQGAVRYESLMK